MQCRDEIFLCSHNTHTLQSCIPLFIYWISYIGFSSNSFTSLFGCRSSVSTIPYIELHANGHKCTCAHVSLHNFVHISALVSHRIYLYVSNCVALGHFNYTFFENVALSISLCARALAFHWNCLFNSILWDFKREEMNVVGGAGSQVVSIDFG